MQAQQWPDAPVEARPGARWWWLGSAVDEKNLTYNLEEYARTGIGAVEITPIYGVQGNDANEIQFLSPRWMEVVTYAPVAGLPCISVPVGFNDAGLPMGMQLIGQPQDDAGVLRLAAAYEQLIGDWLAVRPSSAT